MIHRGRLFRRYFALILALVSGALLVSSAIGLYFSYQENKAALASLQREKAVAAAARIESFIRQIETQLAFAALPQLGPPAGEQRRLEFLKLLRLVPAVTDVAYIDAAGRERLAVSRLAMDVADSGKDRAVHIVKNGAKGIVYLALAVTAGTFAAGGSSSSSGSTTSLTAGLLSTPGGVFLVVAIGIVLIAIAGYLVVKGVTRRFERDLSMPGGTAGRSVRILGTVGYIARGVAMAGVGVLFLFAAATNDPEKSSGLDGALRTIADLPAGKILLVLVGAGWIAYGVYAFFRARYTRL